MDNIDKMEKPDKSHNKKLTDRLHKLESLVEELLKDSPVEEIIEKQMKELEIPYTLDPVERINRVLGALHPHAAVDEAFELEV
jgi:hypothetical protein